MADLLTWARERPGTSTGSRDRCCSARSSRVRCRRCRCCWPASRSGSPAGSPPARRTGPGPRTRSGWARTRGCSGRGDHLDLAAAHRHRRTPRTDRAVRVGCRRTGRRARHGSATPGWAWRFAVRGGDGRGFGVVAAVTAMAASTSQVHPRPSAAFAGGFVLAFLAGGAGLVSGPPGPCAPGCPSRWPPSLPARPRPCCWWWRPRRWCSPAGCSAARCGGERAGRAARRLRRCAALHRGGGRGGAQRGAADRRLPARPRLPGRRRHPGVADGGVARPGARVPAAGGAAGGGPAPWWTLLFSACRCWLPRRPRCSCCRRHPVRGEDRRACGLAPGSAAACCSPCWPPWPAARSGPAG